MNTNKLTINMEVLSSCIRLKAHSLIPKDSQNPQKISKSSLKPNPI